MKTIAEIQTAVTEMILSIMEKGCSNNGALWQQTIRKWGANGMPYNGTTGRQYNGINVLILWVAAMQNGYSTNAWMTFKQAQGKGWQVKKGSKGQWVTYWQLLKKVDKATGKEVTIPLLKTFYVFNADQVEGYVNPQPATDTDNETPRDPTAEIQHIIEANGINLQHGECRAYYVPALDYINMPPREAFSTEAAYSHVALHEITHWTGHPSRLDRLKSCAKFGNEEYAFEELVAELGAAFALARLGIGESQMEHHASYLQSWIKALKNDKSFIFKAASEASKAVEYYLPQETLDDMTE